MPHNLEDNVLAFIRNSTSGAAPMVVGNIAPGQTPGLGSSNQSTTSSSHGRSDSHPERTTMSTYHNGDKIRTLVMPTHQEVQMVSDTICRKAKERAKVEVSKASATIVESQIIRPSSVMQKVEKQKERERSETTKVGITAEVGQSEKDGLTVKVGTLQAKWCGRPVLAFPRREAARCVFDLD